ncbi:MAG: hypothetical protein K2N85_11580 [Lachnospiraceae bacterium]|nr:hypothetical protein [Lachnospiraceae bacterium]
MSDININSKYTESVISELIIKIQTEIIDAAQTSKDNITNAVVNSSGDFIDSLISEVETEAEIMNKLGELLIAIANYIQSAAITFTSVDTKYSTTFQGFEKIYTY